MDVHRHQQFAERVVRHQRYVFGYIVSLVANRADAEELFQQTCLTLWESWDRFDPALDFTPWACGIAHNHVRNFQRKKQAGQVHLAPDVVEILAGERERFAHEESSHAAALRECLQGLSSQSRAVIEGYYGGRTVAEIARERSATHNAIYKLLDRIRLALHDCVMSRLAGESL